MFWGVLLLAIAASAATDDCRVGKPPTAQAQVGSLAQGSVAADDAQEIVVNGVKIHDKYLDFHVDHIVDECPPGRPISESCQRWYGAIREHVLVLRARLTARELIEIKDFETSLCGEGPNDCYTKYSWGDVKNSHSLWELNTKRPKAFKYMNTVCGTESCDSYQVP